jgi:predicted esterase
MRRRRVACLPELFDGATWRRRWTARTIGFCLGALVTASAAFGSRITLYDGRTFSGKVALIATTVQNPQAPVDGRSIVLLDDGLRQIFMPFRQVRETNELDAGEPVETFVIPQQVCETGAQVATVGPIVRVTPFDEYGRRILAMRTQRGIEEVLQGITEITPEWTKIECVDTMKIRFTWDMRVATNSIPRDMLSKILAKQVEPTNLDQRLKIVRLYLQSERFKDAEQELQAIVADFPNQQPQFQPTIVRLQQLHARRILEEIEKRRESGQHGLCRSLLKNFPAQNVAGVILQRVREMETDYDQLEQRGKKAIDKIDALLAEAKETQLKLRSAPLVEEIRKELSLNTLDRMASFLQFADEPSLPAEDRLALAFSGWLVGSDYAIRNLPTAVSLYDTRNLMRQYLAEPVQAERTPLVEQLRKQEGFTPELTARLLAMMKPPIDTPAPTPPPPPAAPAEGTQPPPPRDPNAPPEFIQGQYRLVVDVVNGEPPVEYFVQLPPEYDPHRRYPMIMSLHGAGSNPALQLEWWCGGVGPDGYRYGHAGRQGYIVVAPAWTKEQQQGAEYSPYEHFAVLNVLRDVYRRFSVDTDRVFLSGHSLGGDVAWDVAMAHPDLWAGFIGISSIADKTLNYYWENAKYVPTYLICGEMDGSRWVGNGTHMDRYLNGGYDTTIVRYKGRGHEHFLDEIIRLFDWMGRKKRNFFPEEFKCRSVRGWDNFFWWVEIADPLASSIVDPNNWPPKNMSTLYAEAKKNKKNGLHVTTGAGKATVWLAPEIIDFKQPTEIWIRGRRANKAAYIEPDAAIILEDVRGRGDRQHPFWAKVESN